MVAYLIAGNDVTNAEMMEEYAKLAGPTLAPYDAKLLAPSPDKLDTGGGIEHLEGDFRPGRVVLIAFPSMERALAWYNSPEYQAIINLRLESTVGSLMFVEGV